MQKQTNQAIKIVPASESYSYDHPQASFVTSIGPTRQVYRINRYSKVTPLITIKIIVTGKSLNTSHIRRNR